MGGLIGQLEALIGAWATEFLLGFLGLAGLVTLNTMFMVWFERKVAGFVQGRLGPMERGPHGILQTLVDVGKLIGKESIVPKQADKPLFVAAPVISFVPALALLSLLPYDEGLVITDAQSGVLLVFAFGGVSLMGLFTAAWASNNKFALLGGMRAVSQNIAYELPLLLSTMAVVLVAGTLNLSEIVAHQAEVGPTWVLFHLLALGIFVIAATAETNRAPFDIPEAESELVAGFHTEYTGMSFSVFFLAEYTYMFVICGVGATLFLGGSNGPFLPGVVWFFLKVYFLLFLMVMARWTYPRLRFDQLMNLAWKFLIPLALLNLLGTALVLKVV